LKTIGILGGMSWESTTEYYKLINIYTKTALGGAHSAKIIMYSYDYHELEFLLENNKWKVITESLINEAIKLRNAGADFLMIGANTMHLVADEVEKGSGLEVLHIAKTTRSEILLKGLNKIGLLGTKYTMESPMYPSILSEDQIEVILPTDSEQHLIHDVIYKELILGKFKLSSKQKFIHIIKKMIAQGAQGIILGCTEIPLLISHDDVEVPIFNTMELHVKHAVQKALE